MKNLIKIFTPFLTLLIFVFSIYIYDKTFFTGKSYPLSANKNLLSKMNEHKIKLIIIDSSFFNNKTNPSINFNYIEIPNLLLLEIGTPVKIKFVNNKLSYSTQLFVTRYTDFFRSDVEEKILIDLESLVDIYIKTKEPITTSMKKNLSW